MHSLLNFLRSYSLPKISTGLRASWSLGYGLAQLRQDVLAGITIGIVAVPLAMALAIATGVAPQHGLYTAIVAGAIIALTGGSRFSVSGPTAAFVVILFPIVQTYGIGGLLVATLMAGLILVALGLARMGALIQFVPYPVVLGFTAGIAVVIATLQVPDFFGLSTAPFTEHYLGNIGIILDSLPTINLYEFGVGLFTLAILLLWPRLQLPVPGPLVGLIAGALAAYGVNHWLGTSTAPVETIASRFTWTSGGESGTGIPPIAPTFNLPWHLPGADGKPLTLNFALISALLGPAFAIAMLGAIESLLCAVVADGMTRSRHDPNAELIGQGLGNIAVPFFGGITATAAIARTATNIRSGAQSPIASVIHALVVLAAVVGLAKLLGYVPMAALAALLFVIAWNMSEAKHFVETLRSAPAGDIAVLLVCFLLTVLFDMVVAVAVGMGLASALFIRRMAAITRSDRVDSGADPRTSGLPKEVVVYDVNGPLFFGAADKAIASLQVVDPGVQVVIMDMQDVPSIDGTAIAALKNMTNAMRLRNIALIFVGLTPRQIVKLRRAGIRTVAGKLTYRRNIAHAKSVVERWLGPEGQKG